MFNTIKDITKKFFVAIYIRLSKEDDNLGESESIQNQKLLLTKYVQEQGYTLVDVYIDDGYTGTNFERPAFQRMLKDIELGKVNMVITKDLSRLSRDYIGTGEYVEKWFPAHGVRYVALTDAIDTSIDSANNDIAPFKAILNDMYAKDLSKKIRTALHTMQSEGKWVGGCAPFGYKVDPNDKNHLVIDEIEGPIVKRIFTLFLEGYRINQIRNTLNDERVPTFSTTRGRNFERSGNGNIYGYWCNTTLKKILQNRLYVGDMIQNRRSRVNYKYRKVVRNPEKDWIIVENTHEAIISHEEFDKIQKMLPKQTQKEGKKEYFLLDGLLKCADCGHNIGIRPRRKNGKTTTICNYYRKYRTAYKLCTCHGFDYDNLENGVLKIVKIVMTTLNSQKIELSVKDKCNNNVNSLDNIKNSIIKMEKELEIQKSSLDNMYMDKIQNKITEEMYRRVEGKVLKEIEQLETKIKENTNYINELESSKDKVKNLEDIVKEFLDVETPTRDLVLKIINHIGIHDDGNIDIHFNFKELNIIYDNCVA